MNSKGEWNGPRIPRISIEVGDRTITQNYSGQGQGQTQWNNSNPGTCDNRTTTPEEKEKARVLKWEQDARTKARLLISSMKNKRKPKDRQPEPGQDTAQDAPTPDAPTPAHKMRRMSGPDVVLGYKTSTNQ